MLREGKITLGHAKPLLGLDKPEKMLSLAREIVARGLTVRDVERRLKTESPQRTRAKKPLPRGGGSASIKAAEALIRRRLQTDVQVARKDGGAGTISVRFYSDDDFERIMELMGIKLD